MGLDPSRNYNPEALKAAYRKDVKKTLLMQAGLKRSLLRW